jgi:hypothetical protein
MAQTVSDFLNVAGDCLHTVTVAPRIRHLADRPVRIARAMHFNEALLHDSVREGIFPGAMKDMPPSFVPHKD